MAVRWSALRVAISIGVFVATVYFIAWLLGTSRWRCLARLALWFRNDRPAQLRTRRHRAIAGAWPAWLGETPAGGDELQALLRPFPAERMQAHPIGSAIGNLKNDDASLIERVSLA
jgi:hypothetical protein